jgi:hypothetical protein
VTVIRRRLRGGRRGRNSFTSLRDRPPHDRDHRCRREVREPGRDGSHQTDGKSEDEPTRESPDKRAYNNRCEPITDDAATTAPLRDGRRREHDRNTRSGELVVHASGQALGTQQSEDTVLLKLIVFIARLAYSPNI